MMSYKFKLRVIGLLAATLVLISVTLLIRTHREAEEAFDRRKGARDLQLVFKETFYARTVKSGPNCLEPCASQLVTRDETRLNTFVGDTGRTSERTSQDAITKQDKSISRNGIYRTTNSRKNIVGDSSTTVIAEKLKTGEETFSKQRTKVGCRIPDLNPYDPSVEKFIRTVPGYPDCIFNATLTYMDAKGRICINKTVAIDVHQGRVHACTYHTFSKSNANDDLANYSSVFITFRDKSQPISADFVRVVCFEAFGKILYENMHALINKNKSHVMDKIDFWKRHPKTKRPLSVLLLGFDSMSRSNFIRTLPKTYGYLTNHLSSFVMKGMNKVHDNTFPNLVPLLTGLSVGRSNVYPPELKRYQWQKDKEEYYDGYPLIWKNFSNRNYVTMMAEDREDMSTFNYMARGFRQQPTDFYLRPLYLAMRDSPVRGKSKPHCFGGDYLHRINFDYLFNFVKSYQDVPTFAFTFLSDLSHEELNTIKFADNEIHALIKKLKDGGYLNHTALIVFGDHGHRFDDIRRTLVGRLEERLPFFSLTMPQDFLEKQPWVKHYLNINADRLTTLFDVHRTLLDILNFNQGITKNQNMTRGMSLFDEIPISRSCSDAHIEQHFCSCQVYRKMEVDGPLVVNGALYLVANINRQLSQYQNLCAHLKIAKVDNAQLVLSGENILKERVMYDINATMAKVEFHQLVVSIKTKPGGALFEATLRYDVRSKAYTISGDISRINKYGNQSICINDAILRKYCFCNSNLN